MPSLTCTAHCYKAPSGKKEITIIVKIMLYSHVRTKSVLEFKKLKSIGFAISKCKDLLELYVKITSILIGIQLITFINNLILTKNINLWIPGKKNMQKIIVQV